MYVTIITIAFKSLSKTRFLVSFQKISTIGFLERKEGKSQIIIEVYRATIVMLFK